MEDTKNFIKNIFFNFNNENELHCTIVLNNQYVRWVVLNNQMKIYDLFKLAEEIFNNKDIKCLEINDMLIPRKCNKKLIQYLNEDDTIYAFT